MLDGGANKEVVGQKFNTLDYEIVEGYMTVSYQAWAK